jgi:hypothetical protein
MKDLRLLAILAGFLFAEAGAFLARTAAALAPTLLALSPVAIDAGPYPILLASIGLTSFFALIGGFTTGRLARAAAPANALLAGGAASLVSLCLPGAMPAWATALNCGLTLACAAAGGYLAQIAAEPVEHIDDEL